MHLCCQQCLHPLPHQHFHWTACRSPLVQLGVKLQRFVQRVARRAAGSAPWEAAAEELGRVLARIDALGAQGAAPVAQEAVQAIDRKVKA